MTRRRALQLAAVALLTVLLQLVLVRAMAHGHVAHVLLGAGHAAPPVGAMLLAVTLVVVRFAAVVLAPGALLAALASLAAHVLVGPPRGGGGQRDGAGEDAGAAGSALLEGAGTGARSGAGIKSGEERSGPASAAMGTSIEGRAT